MIRGYGVYSFPTVMLTTPDGHEVGRLVGYDGDPSVYHRRLETLRQEKPLWVLHQKWARDPGDLAVAARLARYYTDALAQDSACVYAKWILDHEAAAKTVEVDLGPRGRVSAFELGLFTQTRCAVADVMWFANEYPNSVFLDDALWNLGRFLYADSTRQAAYGAYATLLETYPTNPFLLKRLAQYHGRKGVDPGLVLGYLNSAYEKRPDVFDFDLRKAYAQVLCRASRSDRALEVFGPEYIRLYITEQDAVPLNRYAWFWALEGDNLASALEASRRSLELKKDADFYDTLALIYWKLGKRQEAFDAQRKAVRLAPRTESFRKRLQEMREEARGGGERT